MDSWTVTSALLLAGLLSSAAFSHFDTGEFNFFYQVVCAFSRGRVPIRIGSVSKVALLRAGQKNNCKRSEFPLKHEGLPVRTETCFNVPATH